VDAPEPSDKSRGLRLPRFLRPREEHTPPPHDGPATAPEDALRVAAAIAGRLLIVIAFCYVLLWLLNQISLVTITITVAVMLSAILRPLVNSAVHAGVPRALAAPVVFLLGVGSIGIAMWFVVTQVTGNMDTITTRLNEAGFSILGWLQNGPAKMSQEQVNNLSTDLAGRLTNARGDLASGALATATSVVSILTGSILCLFALLFLLLDNGTIWNWVVGLFPNREQPRILVAGAVAWKTLVAYMRSTILLALINALTMVPIMMFAEMDLVVPLGVLLFLGSLIPMIGMLVAGAVLMLVALVMQGPVTAFAMGIALFLVIQLEGNLLNPYILGKAVSIHPLAILATVTGGALVGGAFGAFVAVPFVAIVNNVITAVRRAAAGPEHQAAPEMVRAGSVVDDVMADPAGPGPAAASGSAATGSVANGAARAGAASGGTSAGTAAGTTAGGAAGGAGGPGAPAARPGQQPGPVPGGGRPGPDLGVIGEVAR